MQMNGVSADSFGRHNSITKQQLQDTIREAVPSLQEVWPSDHDVRQAFRVFDSEGLGFIKVTLLKRFLVQAQLGVEDGVCELWAGRMECV